VSPGGIGSAVLSCSQGFLQLFVQFVCRSLRIAVSYVLLDYLRQLVVIFRVRIANIEEWQLPVVQNCAFGQPVCA